MSVRKILIIGGTGVISSAVLGMLAKSRDTELYVINRGHHPLPVMANHIICDANDTAELLEVLYLMRLLTLWSIHQIKQEIVYIYSKTIQDNISLSPLSWYSIMKITSFSMKTLYRRTVYHSMEEISRLVRMYSTKQRRRAFQSLSLDLHRRMALTVSH